MTTYPSRRKLLILIVILILTIVYSDKTFGQSQFVVSKEYHYASWYNFVKAIEEKNDIRFYYEKELIPDFQLSFKNDTSCLEQILTDNFNDYGILIAIDHLGNVFLTKESSVITEFPSSFFQLPIVRQSILPEDSARIESQNDFLKTTNEFIAETIIIGTRENGNNKNKAIISGFVTNLKTGSPIDGATIIQSGAGTGVAADEKGFYKLVIDKGKHVLTINSVSTVEKKIEVDVLSDGNLNIALSDKVFLLEDVIISARNYSKVRGTKMGLERIPMIAVKKVPLVFGERDVIKIALLLPGVQSVGEGSSGFNVRGSPTDQNIFYLNNAPIYNTSHVAGFFSAFNSDAISEFSLYKNYIPVNFGGRLASVFDVAAKQGSMDKTKINGGIGLITGRILAEGPIKKDKSSYLMAMRSTYSNWMLSMVDDIEIGQSKVNFADLITNLSFQLNDNNKLNMFSYVSQDAMNLAAKSKYNYQNIAASINWKHYFKNNHNFELSLAHSSYAFNEENTEVLSFAYKHLNKIMHNEVSANLNLNLNENHKLIIGTNSVLYNIDKGNPAPLNEESQFRSISLGSEKGLESGFYMSDEWTISPQITLNGGIRYNLYSYLGPQKVYKYFEGLPKSEASIQDTLNFGNNERIQTYNGLDFRLGTSYMLTNDLSFKIAYNRLHQYMYILTNTVAIAPNYKWKLTDFNTKPMISDQFSAGIYANFPAHRVELTLEAYYKKIQNLVELKNGASLFLNEYVERSTLQGKLAAYGIELMLKKPYGSITGWINYTYSNSSVVIDSEFAENRINYGAPYPSNYDKPHAINLVINRDFSKRFSMSANFVYATGRPITLPISMYYMNGVKYLNYSKRNEHRIPDYVRLDLSFNLEGNLKRRKAAHSYWSFSIYNLLGRKNAYSVYFKKEGDSIKGYKFSVFGSQIYSLTYNFKLGNYDN